MRPEPCSVCGGTETTLRDGFYYCVECGTQDVNARETLVEHVLLSDGTLAMAERKKITAVLKDAIEMSGEWHKWHTFNFILFGLVEELMNLGASTGFKKLVIWIWTKYMKEFMNKDQMGAKAKEKEKYSVSKSTLFEYEDEIDEEEKDNMVREKYQVKAKQKKMARNAISVITKDLLMAILYLALNLDKSDIQLSHFLRFMKEGRLSIKNWKKFVPEELDQKSIPDWQKFTIYRCDTHPNRLRYLAFSLVKVLHLNPPIMPDLTKIADNFVKELCLPKDFKNLVHSLMHCFPLDLTIRVGYVRHGLVRIPDYEGVVMSYILVALKMCFGLDDCYEIKLSDAVSKINQEENRLKSYKLGMYSDATDRLFSFLEWAHFLQYRKTMLCKHFLPLAHQHNFDVDDVVFMEQVEEKKQKIPQLSDNVTMDILNKIQTFELGSSIPKTEFATTLTSLTSYTEVILQYIKDPDIKLLLSEDFSQYSLTYTCENLKLLVDGVNIVTGVNEENKTFNEEITGTLAEKERDTSMVYVRNCENKNWLKTNPPDLEHVFKIETSEDDCDSDHGYDSNIESTIDTIKITNKTVEDFEETKELETIEEEKEGISIFDDAFDDIIEDDKKPPVEIVEEISSFDFHNTPGGGDFDSKIDDSSNTEVIFDPKTFDRENTIKELVLAACKKYKISIPKEYNPTNPIQSRERVKRKNNETGEICVRKKRVITKRGEAQKIEENILSAYYANMENELLNKVSEHLKFVIGDSIGVDSNYEANNTDGDITAEFNEANNDSNTPTIFEDKSKTSEDIEFADVTENSDITHDKETNIDDLIPKPNPKFDEKTHDIKQLYVKYSQGLQFGDILEIEDAHLESILDQKIEECKQNALKINSVEDLRQEQENSNGSDEEMPSEDDDDMEYIQIKDIQMKPLIPSGEDLKEFKYWFRLYKSDFMRKATDSTEKFLLELNEYFPKSFIFIINECAAMLDCSAFSLYRHMQNLERLLIMRKEKE